MSFLPVRREPRGAVPAGVAAQCDSELAGGAGLLLEPGYLGYNEAHATQPQDGSEVSVEGHLVEPSQALNKMSIPSPFKRLLFASSPRSRNYFVAGISGSLGILCILAPWASTRIGLAVCGVILAASFGLALQLYSAVVRSVHALAAQQDRIGLDSFRQTQALFYIYSKISPRLPLPPMREMAISPDFAAKLISLIQKAQPRTIVELGSGVSTIISCYCLEKLGGGSLLSFDHDAKYAEITRAQLAQHGLDKFGRVIHAPLKPRVLPSGTWQWYELDEGLDLRSIDILVIDGPPQVPGRLTRYPAVPVLYDRLSDSAIIILDDAARADEAEAVNRWLREYPDLTSEYLAYEKGAVILRRPERRRL